MEPSQSQKDQFMGKRDFKKVVKTKEYEMLFDSTTGFEMIRGANGKTDPFFLELPSLIDIGIMGHCENSCHFCYQGKQDEPNMSLDDFKLIIDQVKHHTNQVALGGRGDPNLHENFLEILQYARKNNVVPNYTTSGNGLTDDQITSSRLCGAVAVSDYGQDFTYDAIKRFMDAGIKTNIHMIFNTVNYEKIIKILSGYNPWIENICGKGKEILERKILVDISHLNAVIFLLYKTMGQAKDMPELIPNKYERSVFLERVLNPQCDFKVGIDSCLANYIMKSRIKISNAQKLTIDSCEGARMSTYISPSLQMVPCSFADHNDMGFNLHKEDIEYVWKRSHNFKRFRSQLKKNPHDCPLGF